MHHSLPLIRAKISTVVLPATGKGGFAQAQPCLGPSLSATAAGTTQTPVLIAETAESSAFCPKQGIVIFMHAHTDTSKEPFSFQAVLLC